MLRCIRCSACLNACPVYERTGGHAYGNPYPGPIGAVLSPQLRRGEQTDLEKSLPFASSLCGACLEVCPVKIDIPKILVQLRSEIVNDVRREHPLNTELLAMKAEKGLLVSSNLLCADLAWRHAVAPPPLQEDSSSSAPVERLDYRSRRAAALATLLSGMVRQPTPRRERRRDPATRSVRAEPRSSSGTSRPTNRRTNGATCVNAVVDQRSGACGEPLR